MFKNGGARDLNAYHLLGDEEDGLQVELPLAGLKQIFK
jgi:hypothetical protein